MVIHSHPLEFRYIMWATNSQTHNMYDVIREQSQSLVDAFSMTEELARKGAQTMDRFNVLDARVEELKTICQG